MAVCILASIGRMTMNNKLGRSGKEAMESSFEVK